MNDWELLKRYAEENCEDAFRALVERYAGMVYHTALRQSRDAHAAEEAAQEVFAALAQKAGSIRRQATLYGWLFRATRYAVLNQARKNTNRERREQEAMAMQPTSEANETDSMWEQIAPHLNDVLDKLSADDREAVMIRFFGDKSHAEVAEALGVSEAAARKRVSRAIERLRVIFARRGVAMSSVALTAALAAHGAKGAPVKVMAILSKAALAKAAAGTATVSSGGLLSMLTTAKGTLIAATAGVAVIVAAGFAVSRAISHGSAAGQPLVTNLANGSSISSNSVQEPLAPSTPVSSVTGSSTALNKVKAALHDTNETTVYPNSVMREAIAGLGTDKKAAVPVLKDALSDTNAEVRLRAVDGVAMVGAEAKQTAPLLLGLLRDGGFRETIPQTSYTVTGPLGASRDFPIYTDNMLLYALGQIHPPVGTVSALAEMVRQNKSVRAVVYQATSQFPNGPGRTLQAGGWLWEIAGENSGELNDAFRPLLEDTDLAVQSVAALSLVSALGSEADSKVFPVAAAMMTSGDDIFLRRQGMALLDKATVDFSDGGKWHKSELSAARLGPYLSEIVSALIDVAYHSSHEAQRVRATKMLEILSPEITKSNPGLAAVLEQEREMEAFVQRATSGEAAAPEIAEGLKKYPKAAPEVAAFYARNGSNGVELLPAFGAALSALAPAPEASLGDRSAAMRARARLADAMQKITPQLPKPIFTGMDAVVIERIMREPEQRGDAVRSEKISAALKQAGWPNRKTLGSFDVSPEQMRRLLAAMKDADATTYDALVAKVKEIDPHFFDAAASEKN